MVWLIARSSWKLHVEHLNSEGQVTLSHTLTLYPSWLEQVNIFKWHLRKYKYSLSSLHHVIMWTFCLCLQSCRELLTLQSKKNNHFSKSLTAQQIMQANTEKLHVIQNNVELEKPPLHWKTVFMLSKWRRCYLIVMFYLQHFSPECCRWLINWIDELNFQFKIFV